MLTPSRELLAISVHMSSPRSISGLNSSKVFSLPIFSRVCAKASFASDKGSLNKSS